MDRTREARRVTLAAATNGLPRRRHRSSSIRDSPEDDGPMELLETARLRDRGAVKKDRDRERDRERERERDRERERERERDRDRLSRTSKRRRDRLMSSREEGGDDSSEESVNDDEDDDDDGGGGSSVRILPSSASLSSSSLLNHQQQQQQQQHHHRKSYPPQAKVFRPATPASPWKATDEMIGVSVPRKARSASTKRSHECWATSAANVIGGEQILRQASTSPVQAGAAGILSSPSPAPPSPSSSNASMRKKMKQNGPKQRPPKSTSKSVSSAQEDIEIEIAEVLYGMMRQPQSQGPKQEIVGNDYVKFDSREANKLGGDAKSRVSSPISNSPSMVPPSSSVLPPNSNSAAAPISAIAPKRKRPRPVEDESPSVYPGRNGTIPFAAKIETERSPKAEAASPHLEKNSGSAAENGLNNGDLSKSEAAAPTQKQDQMNAQAKVTVADLKPSTGESENHLDVSRKEGSQLPSKASPDSHVNPTSQQSEEERDNSAATKGKLSAEIESQREEKFQIDLMAPPPTRSSPERDGGIDFVAVDPKAMVAAAETEVKPNVLEDNKAVKIVKDDAILVADNQKPAKTIGEEAETQNPVSKKERAIDLQLDLEKADKESGTSTVNPNKINHNQQHQPQQSTSEKNATGPSPWPMPTWPGGIAPVGYMAPLLRDPVKLQGVVSMDSSTVQPSAIQPPHLLFNQPKPKRCATHCYIARNIHCNQQFIKINPFWAAQAGSASLYGAKACGLNVVPPTELHVSMPGGGATTVQDKGQTLAIFPSHAGKDKGSSGPNMVDAAQRKQILVQQPLPPGAPSNILHGPTFIFPLSQQQAAAAVSVQPGSVKSPPVSGSTTSSSISNTASVSATPSGAAAAPTMSFSYPNMSGSETQYLAILQNNGYPFPIPAHVGAPAYRGSHAQAMPFFNGSFYSSQILHPSQLQQQQPPAHSNQSQQAHQNPSMSTGSSSSQKQQQNQQSRPHGSGTNGNVQVFPPPKMQSSQQVQLQQRPQLSSAHVPHQQRQLEGEIGGEDSPSTADSRVSRNINIYGQNFAIPMHSPNFAFMTPASTGGPASSCSNPGEKKQQVGKSGGEPHTSQAFAMSFASISGANTPGLDISSFGPNHAILQSLPEATRQGYQIMAAVAAQAAQQKKNYPIPEDGKRVANDGPNIEEERKGVTVKNSAAVGQSIAFSRPDLSSSAGSTLPGNVIDSSARALNLGSSSVRTPGNVMPGSVTAVNAPTSQQLQRTQQKLQQQQQQQLLQLQQKQQQQQLAAAVSARSKTPVTSNGSAYPAHITSSAMTAKFPNGLAFPPNLVQSTNSPAQSPQWNTLRTSTSQVTSPPSASSTMKNISQQGRSQQSHTQISFAANPKASTQGQQPASSTQSPSPPMVASSPTTSISKSAGGSPRMTGSSVTGNKAGQASSLSSQQVKSSSVVGQKSSPVGGRNVQSILGNPHITSSTSTGTKPPAGLQQQQQQQMQQKHALQQAQLFSNAYAQAQAQAQAHAQHSSNAASAAQAANAYYMQRHRNEQQQQQQQPSPGSTTSSSMLSLCSTVSLANTTTSDPAKMVVAAGNMKGGVLTSQGIIHHGQFASSQASGKLHQLVPPGYPYVHPVPTVPAAVQVKQGEQKQPAGD